MKSLKKIVLLDVHAILHRAYHALPGFTSSKGEPTGALYGLSAFLIKIIADLSPDYLIACYDLPGPTFRKKIYDGYKAGRPKTDSDLITQIIRSRDLFKAFNIPIYEKAGFEADDIIGTIAEYIKKLQTTNYKLQTIIASGDMDTLQLVSGDLVVVYTLRKGINDTVIYNEILVKERFGFGPEFMADYKGLRGDPSDNIIGVRGIGEKTATELIKSFGSIESLYKVLKDDPSKFLKASIKQRVIDLLREGEEEAVFSKMLATIKCDVEINFSLPEKRWRDGLDTDSLFKFFGELEFKALGPRFQIALQGTLGINLGANFPGVSERTSSIPDVPAEENRGVDLPIASLPHFQPVAIAAWLLNSDLTNPKIPDLLSIFKASDLDEALQKLPLEIKDKGLDYVYYKIELPIIPIIKEAENLGLLIDTEHLKKMSKEYHKKLEVLERQIWQLAGEDFNINSSKQLGVVLFDKMKLTVKGLKKTPGGARSTRESELLKLKDLHSIVPLILSQRELQKLLSTYIDPLPNLVDANGRLHTSLNQMGTTTGRISSSNPNLQNIPANGDIAKEIRKAFIAPPNHKLAAFDYSQIEMRVLAWLSGDEALISIFKQGLDIHTAVAARVFNMEEVDITKEMRRKAKVINFGILYGMGVSSLRKNLNSTMEEAETFYNNFFIQFPKIRDYFEKIKNLTRQNGYTVTAYGRRRYFPMINSSLPYVRAEAERMAVNASIQGTATADIIKMAMQRVQIRLLEEGLDDKAHLVLQVHDELLYEVRDDNDIDKIMRVIKEAMETAGLDRNIKTDTLPVFFLVNSSWGDNWGELTSRV